MDERSLSIRLNGRPAATLRRDRSGRLSMSYHEAWQAEAGSALSVRMPVRSGPYGHEDVSPFFAGLLPDSVAHRRQLKEILHAENGDFGLLARLGTDCAGAVSVVVPDAPVVADEDVVPAFETPDDAGLHALVSGLPRHPLMADGREMRVGLAGVNDKTAVALVRGRIATPLHGTPTTHILKTDIQGLPDSVKVENFCLRVAGRLGMSVPRSTVMTARDLHFMVVSRYDRYVTVDPDGDRHVRRQHQEDFCQATGIHPSRKFQSQGGPSWKDAFDLCRLTADPEASRDELLSRAVFQFLIGNPDAHGKNYSLVHRGGQVRLAPLYDVNNSAAFRDRFARVRPRMAMSVGRRFDPDGVERRDWVDMADECGLDPEIVLERLSSMAERLPEAMRAEGELARDTPSDTPRLGTVMHDVARRCARATTLAARPEEAGPRQATTLS